MLIALYSLMPMAGLFILMVRFFRRATTDKQAPNMSEAELTQQFALADEYDAQERAARKASGHGRGRARRR